MSQVSSGKGKENAAKTKYASLNLSQTYKGTKAEPRTSTGQPRHGMQSLGKVGQSRRLPAPANLPSLKKENKGNDPSVNIVHSSSGWGSRKENKEQTTKQEDQQGPTTQKQAKVGQGQDISLRPNAGVAIKQGDGTKTWSSMQTSTVSTSQPTTTYFRKEFPKLGGEGEAGQGVSEKEPQEEKGVQQTRQIPPRFQNDQKFTDGPGGPMLPPGPMVGFPPDQRQMFNGGPSFFGRPPFMDTPYGPGPMTPAMFHQHNYMMQMAGRYQFPPGRADQFPPFDPNFARGMPPAQRMPTMPQKPPVAQGERPLTVKDEDLKNLAYDDDDDGDGWAGAQEEVDYNIKLKFDDSEEEDEETNNTTTKDGKSYDTPTSRNDQTNQSSADANKESTKEHGEEKGVKLDKPGSQKGGEARVSVPVSQSWTELPQGYPGQMPGIPYSQAQWRGTYPPPAFDHSRGGPPQNYPYPPPPWFYTMPHPGYGVPIPQGQQPGQQQGQAQGQQQLPMQMQQQPPQVAPKASAQATTPLQDNTDNKDSAGQKQQSAKVQKRKEPESTAIQEARKRKQEEESRLEAERKAAAQAKLYALEEKMKKKNSEKGGPEGSEEKRVSESDSYERSQPSTKDKEEVDGRGHRDRRDSEASDTSRASSQMRSERSHSKNQKDVPPRFRKQHQQQIHRTSSEENSVRGGDEADYLSLPLSEGRTSPAMSQSSDSFPIRKIMKRHDSSRSDDACSVHSQDSWGMGQGASTSLKEQSESDNAEGSLSEGSKANKLAGDDEENSRHAVNEKESSVDKYHQRSTVEKKQKDFKGAEHSSEDSRADAKLAWEDKKSRRDNDKSYAEKHRDGDVIESSSQKRTERSSEESQTASSVEKLSKDDSGAQNEDFESKRSESGSTRRSREQRSSRNIEDTDYNKGDKYERANDKKNFKRLEKSSMSKGIKSSSVKERFNKSEKDQVKRSEQTIEPKRASAWSKVVAGEKDATSVENNSEGKVEKETHKTLSDIQKEEEEKERKETESLRKFEESRKDSKEEDRTDYSRRDDYKSNRSDRVGYGDRKDDRWDRRKKYDRGDGKGYDRDAKGYDRGDNKGYDRGDNKGYDRGDNKGHDRGDGKMYKDDRRRYGHQYPRGDQDKGSGHVRDKYRDRGYKMQDREKSFREEESDENDEGTRDSRRDSNYDGNGKYGKGERSRPVKTYDRNRDRPLKGDRDDKDRERTKDRSSKDDDSKGIRGDNGSSSSRRDYNYESRDFDKRDRFKDKGRQKEYYDRHRDDGYYDSYSRRDRKQGYDTSNKRQYEERKRKHDGGRADYKGYKDEQQSKELSTDQGRDESRKGDSKQSAHQEGRDSKSYSSYGQGRPRESRGYSNREDGSNKRETYGDKKGITHKKKSEEEDVSAVTSEIAESKVSGREKKEISKVQEGEIVEDEEGDNEDEVVDNDDGGKSEEYSGGDSENEDYRDREGTVQRSRDREEDEKRTIHDFRGSRDRRGHSRGVSRPYFAGRGGHRPFHRPTRSSYKENFGVRKRIHGEKGSDDHDGEYEPSEEDCSSDEGEGEGNEGKEHQTSRHRDGSNKGALKVSNRTDRESYHRPPRSSRGGQEKRWGKDQPPRFKRQGMINKTAGRGREYLRDGGRGRGYPSYGGVGRGRNRSRPQNQGGMTSRQQEEDWENESGESGTYHTAEETNTSTNQESTHRKPSSNRGKGYSRGHGSRGGQGTSHSNTHEGRQNSFLADRQQVRVGQVGTSAQASTLPAALDGPVQAFKDSEVRSSTFKTSVVGKKSDRGDRTSLGSYNLSGSFQSGGDSVSEITDEPPKKIAKNKASMEAKRNILKEFDLSNIASVVVIDDFGPSTELSSNISNDDDGFVRVTSRKTQKELREKQREEVRKKQREETSQGTKSSKGDKDTAALKSGKSQKSIDQQSGRFQATVPSQGPNSLNPLQVTTSQSQTSNAAMAAVGGWEPAQSLMRTSQIVSNGNVLEGSKSISVPAPPPPVNAWQRPLSFASSVTSVAGTINHSKTPDPKAVGTGKPSSTSNKAAVAVNGISQVPSASSAKQQTMVTVKPVVSQTNTVATHSPELKTEESRDNNGAKKTDAKKDRAAVSTLKSSTGTLSTRKIYPRGTQIRDKSERVVKEGKTFPSRQPVMRRDKLIDRKTKRERPPRFRNISKGRVNSAKDALENEVNSETRSISPLAEAEDKLVTGGSKLQGEDRAPGKRPQSFEGRNQLQTDVPPKSSNGLATTLPTVSSATQVAGEALSRVTRSMPMPLAVGSSELRSTVVERGEEQMASTVLRKSKDDGSSAEEEENAKDTARSVIKSLSDDDEKALETRSLPGTPPLAVEIPEPTVSGPSSDPGRTSSPTAPNSMAQEMSEMSKKVYFTKKLWDDDVSNQSVGLAVVPQSATLTTWSDGTDSSQKVMKDMNKVVSTQAASAEATSEAQSETKEDTSVNVGKPEEKPTPTVTSQSTFGKKPVIEQQNVCKVKPQQQQQTQSSESSVSDSRPGGTPNQNQVLTSQYLIHSPYTVPCQSATNQTAKVHQGYFLPVENLTPSLQQAFLAQSESPRFQELSQQQPISLNIHAVNQSAARSSSGIPQQQQQQQQQEIIRPLVVNNLYPPTVQGGQNVLTWQVVTTHSVHTSSSVSFQSHLQGSHSANVFNQNVTLPNTPLFMTFDPQGATNTSIFSTQRVSSHLQQPPLGLVMQQQQAQTLPSYVGVIPGSHQSSHDHPFGVRTPPTKLAVGSAQMPSAQLHHPSSSLPLGSTTLSRHQPLDAGEASMNHLTSMTSGSVHLPVGQRSVQSVSGMAGMSPAMAAQVASMHHPPGSSQSLVTPEGHMSTQSDLMKHVNAKPFQPSAKTPPSVGVSCQQPSSLSQVAVAAHQRVSQNPLIAPVRPRPVQGRSLPSSSPSAVALQTTGRLGGAVSPVEQGVAYIQNALQVKGQQVPNLSQHPMPGNNLQHTMHLSQALQSQFPEHQGQVVGHSRAFNIHPSGNPLQRFARAAPGPIQRPSPVGVVNGIVPIRPKPIVHHPQPTLNKVPAVHPQVSQHQVNKAEQFQLSPQQPQEMFRSQQHQKMIEETKKFFQKEMVAHVVKGTSKEGPEIESRDQHDAQDDQPGKHDGNVEFVNDDADYGSQPSSAGSLGTGPGMKSSLPKDVITASTIPQTVVKASNKNASGSDTCDPDSDQNSMMAKPQPQRPQERNRRTQKIGK